jgi:hypothetical protein
MHGIPTIASQIMTFGRVGFNEVELSALANNRGYWVNTRPLLDSRQVGNLATESLLAVQAIVGTDDG